MSEGMGVMEPRAVDEQRLNAFLGKAVGDLGAAVSAVLVSIGRARSTSVTHQM
jgi:hypothetical protein